MLKKPFALFLVFFSFSAAAQDPRVVDSLLRLAHSSSADTTRAALYVKLSAVQGAEKSKALAWADTALMIAAESNDARSIAEGNRAKGEIFYRSRAENDSALKYYLDALKYYLDARDFPSVARSEYTLGNVYNLMDRHPDALKAYMACEDYAEKAKSPMYVAYAKNGIGSINVEMKAYDEAERYHREALEIAKKENDNKLLGWTYTCLGNVAVHKGKNDEALKDFTASLEAYKKVNYLYGVAGAYNNIGVCYSAMKKYDEAIASFEQAAVMKQQLSDVAGQQIAYGNISQLYGLKGDTKNALAYAQKSLRLARQSGSLLNEATAYSALAEAYSDAKQFDSAYYYHVLFKQYNDSVFNQTTQQQLTEMQTKYKSDKQQQEIALLQKDNEIGTLYNYVFGSGGVLVLFIAGFTYNRYRTKNKANKLLAEQNAQITSQKKEITDSINYARRIQQSILPSPAAVAQFFPDHFILYRPKDIVSGDFYWLERSGDKILFAAVDCTGHGVPGAMMSVLGYNLLTEAVVEKKLAKPSEILQSLNAGIIRALQRQTEGKTVKDGMDIAFCAFDPATLQLQFAGVFNSLYLVRNGELKIFEADRTPLGDQENPVFSNATIDLQKGDCIYIFTDGYADQFGGPLGKKFKYRQQQETLSAIAHLPMQEQLVKLEQILDAWKGGLEQVDDILVIGVRI